MDAWFFDEKLSQGEILKRATEAFGVQASRQTLTAYFRHREQVLNVPDGERELEPMEDEALATRVGAGMKWDDLQARALRFAGMAVYELSMAEPEKMRVKEIRSLMKTLNEHHRLVLDRRLREERLTVQRMALLVKLKQYEAENPGKEDFERMVLEGAEIWNKAKKKSAECRAELEKLRRAGGNQSARQSEPKAAEGPGDAAQEAGPGEGREVEGENGKDI